MKPNVKPLTSTCASASIVACNPGHARTASTPAASTARQIRNLTTSLTSVIRKEPGLIGIAGSVPGMLLQSFGVVVPV